MQKKLECSPTKIKSRAGVDGACRVEIIMVRTLRRLFCVLALFSASLTAWSATVSTDQSDYSPGETVMITGTGFAPGESVQLQVLNLTDPSDNGPEHDPWTVTADTNGNISTSWLVTPDEGGATLQLTARGLTSGLVAQMTFTDTSHVLSVTVGAPSTNATYGTAQNITYVVTIAANGNGAGTSTPTISGLPTGVSGVFNPASVDLNVVTGLPGKSTNITLTITTVTNTGAVTNTFTVTACFSPGFNQRHADRESQRLPSRHAVRSSPSKPLADGATTASVSGAAALQSAEAFGAGSPSDGKPYAGDTVSLTGTASYAYNSKDVSAASNIIESGLSLTGAKASNYTLIPPSFAATITARCSIHGDTRL